MKPRIYVSGTIELNDNIHSKVKFSLDTEELVFLRLNLELMK